MSYKRNDYLLFALIVAAILFLSVFCLTNTCYWGDDFAAYISEGIAIAEGKFDEQVQLNVLMHPSELPDEALDGSLVYVWGYPLLLALVYKLVGFDRVGFTSIIYYKLPSAIALALMAGVLFLLLRRRFGKPLSFMLAFLFSACYEFSVQINTLYSDVVFLFFAAISLFVLELFLDEKQETKKLVLGVLLGISLWYTYETRLNGISILFACALACVIYYVKARKEAPSGFNRKKLTATVILPFVVFLVFKLVSEAILAPATGNTSDLAGVTIQTVLKNIKGYYGNAKAWIELICNNAAINWINIFLSMMTKTGEDTYGVIGSFCAKLSNICAICVLILALIGIITDGFKKEAHLTVFAVVYLLVVSMLPYNQGVRYIYPVMLLVPIFAGHAIHRGIVLLTTHSSAKLKRIENIIGLAVMSIACILTFTSAVRGIIYERKTFDYVVPTGPESFYAMYAYTPCSVETYNYISENTPKDCVIGFYKPRALYLNTERVSLRTDINGHSLDEVDYFLTCARMGEDQLLKEGNGQFEEIFSNIEFTLYKRIND